MRQDNVVFAPGDEPDDWTEMHSLTTAARVAGLPNELSELMLLATAAAARLAAQTNPAARVRDH